MFFKHENLRSLEYAREKQKTYMFVKDFFVKIS